MAQAGARWISAYSASSSAAQVTHPDDGAAAPSATPGAPGLLRQHKDPQGPQQPPVRADPASLEPRPHARPGGTAPSACPVPARGSRPPAPPRCPAPLPPPRPAPSGTAGPQPGRPLCPAQGKAYEAQRAALNPGLLGLAFPCYCSHYFFFSGNFPSRGRDRVNCPGAPRCHHS